MNSALQAKLVKRIDHSDSLASFVFSPKQQIRYRAGQYAEIEVPHDNPDKRGAKRWMSLASSPQEKNIRFISKKGRQPSSFKQALFSLRPGEEINVHQPMGDFVLPRNPNVPLIFVAGGVGAAPFRGLCQELIINRQARSITMLYGARNQRELLYSDIFTAATEELHLFTTELAPKINQGRITADSVLRHAQSIRHDNQPLIYIAGPALFVQELRDGLAAKNVDPSTILADYFFGYIE